MSVIVKNVECVMLLQSRKRVLEGLNVRRGVPVARRLRSAMLHCPATEYVLILLRQYVLVQQVRHRNKLLTQYVVTNVC